MATNIFTRAKQIRKTHPNKKWQDCVKAAGKEQKVSGVKKTKKIGSAKKVGTVKRKRTSIPKVKVTKKAVTVGRIGAVPQSKKLVQQINVLERQRKQLKNKDLRTINALEINALHRKLNATMKRI